MELSTDLDNPSLATEALEDLIEDDVQPDYRFLKSTRCAFLVQGAIIVNNTRSATSLPKRGEKDFEPDGTSKQQLTLDASRQALFDAISAPIKPKSDVVNAVWDDSTKTAVVNMVRGRHFQSMGRPLSGGGFRLLPEELLYLVERGSAYCHVQNRLLSLQETYARCLSAITLEQYQVGNIDI
jgi:tRNA-splicing endonuclease subunit Sen54